MFPSPMVGDNLQKDVFGGSGFLPRDSFIQNEYFVTAKE